MASTIFPVSSNNISAASTQASASQKTLDFSRVLLAQMASPDISSLFGDSSSPENNSILGSSASSLLGGSSTGSLLSQLSGNSTGQLFSETQMMPIYSNYIGKKVEAIDSATNKKVADKVESVLLQNGIAMLQVGGSFVNPATVTRVE